jgi:1-acyl-sn-glycerol-3-phosphate acyltransferase
MLPLFIFYMMIWMLVFPFDRNKTVTQFFMVLWTRLYLTCNPGWKLRIENRNRIVRNKKVILVSNHQSIIDIALLLQLRTNFKWVSKIEMASVPFVGWVIWLNSHILVRRGDKQSVVKMADACKRTLDRGISVFLFPEGTRSPDNAIQPFKDGAFILAKENEVAILPVVIDGSGNALPNKAFWFKVNQVFTVRVLEEIPVEVVVKYNVEQLSEYTRNKMIDALKDIRKRENDRLNLKSNTAVLKKMGYLSDIRGIMDRYIQVGDAWKEHLNNTREFILKTAGDKKINRLAVFGSGWLLDLPLKELTEIAETIYLYDVVHPPQVLHKISRYKNVIAVTADLTGGTLQAAFEAVKTFKKSGKKPDIEILCGKQFIPDEDTDYVISLNILSQIGEVVSNYLCKHIPFNEEETNRMIELLQLSHLKILISGRTCLITDTEENAYNSDNHLMQTKKLVRCSLPLSVRSSTWDWQFDPLGEYNPGMKTISKVVALEL